MSASCRGSLFGLVILCCAGGAALAAPGDIHRVSGADVVNLRAGPTDTSNIRGRVEQGDEVIELTRDGNWIGVRVLQTGEEGWIYGGLLERVSMSGLLPGDAAAGSGTDAGFLQLSEGFDRLMRRVNGDLGYRMVEDAAPVADGVLQVRPTAAWLRSGGRDAHLLGAVAFYQLWKNYQNGRPVALVMTDEQGAEYIRIADGDLGPELAIAAP
jgi:Bacterial SH3 domain